MKILQSLLDCVASVGIREGTLLMDIHDHLLAAQEGVSQELARSQSDGGFAVSHLGDLDAFQRSRDL
jgi:hypothetical protein